MKFAAWIFLATALSARELPPWTEGTLDIHQIATGRGNAALIVAPDGTTLLIDAGASEDRGNVSSPPAPDGSRRPGQWIGRYVLRQLRATGRHRLDYFVATHLHPDHIGELGPDTPPSSTDPTYLLTGVTDVAEMIPIDTVIDRGFPRYDYPVRWPVGFVRNYWAFIAARQKRGLDCEQIQVGSQTQIHLRYAASRYPRFSIRNLAANGTVWTGRGNETATAVPSLGRLDRADFPDENLCSIALLLSDGGFRYYTGGDLHCDTHQGQDAWRDVETPAARSAGPVDVAVADHHGYFDAVGSESVRALRPQVWVVPAWHITHLNLAVLDRMLSERLYPGPRDVFVTDLMPAAALIDERFRPKMKSISGHIVVRVAPGGDQFRVYVTSNRDETDTILLESGPYQVCPKQ